MPSRFPSLVAAGGRTYAPEEEQVCGLGLGKAMLSAGGPLAAFSSKKSRTEGLRRTEQQGRVQAGEGRFVLAERENSSSPAEGLD